METKREKEWPYSHQTKQTLSRKLRQVSDQWGYIKNQIKSKAEVSQDIINEILEDRVSAETSAYFQSYLEGQGYQDYLEGVNEQHRKQLR